MLINILISLDNDQIYMHYFIWFSKTKPENVLNQYDFICSRSFAQSQQASQHWDGLNTGAGSLCWGGAVFTRR